MRYIVTFVLDTGSDPAMADEVAELMMSDVGDTQYSRTDGSWGKWSVGHLQVAPVTPFNDPSADGPT